MLRQKIILFFLLLCLSNSVFAKVSGDTISTELSKASNVGMFDQPLIDAIFYFVNGIWYAQYIASILFALFGVVGIVWHAFMLWTSNTNVKKAIADICVKFVICSFLFVFYPTITWGCLEVAHDIGLKVCGGITLLNDAFYRMSYEVTHELSVMKSHYARLMMSLKDLNLTKNELKELMKESGFSASAEEIEKFAKEYQITVIENPKWWQKSSKAENARKSQVGYEKYLKAKAEVTKKCFGVTEDDTKELLPSELSEVEIKEKEEGVDYVTVKKNGETKYYAVTDNTKHFENLVGKYRALAQLMGGKVDENFNFEQPILDISNWMLDPFMHSKTASGSTYFGGDDGFLPRLLSCSQMLKSGFLICELLRYSESTTVNIMAGEAENTKIGTFEENVTETPKGFLARIGEKIKKIGQKYVVEKFIGPTINKLVDWIFLLIMWCVIMFVCVQIAINYTITITEYAIVTTISIILLPMMLFKGTGNYTRQLLELFMNMMLKVIIQVCVLMFVYSYFLRVGTSSIIGTDGGIVQRVMNILFMSTMCFLIVSKSDQLPQVLKGSTAQVFMAIEAFKTAKAGIQAGGNVAVPLARATAENGKIMSKAAADSSKEIIKHTSKGMLNGGKMGIKLGAAVPIPGLNVVTALVGGVVGAGIGASIGAAVGAGKATLNMSKASIKVSKNITKAIAKNSAKISAEKLTGVKDLSIGRSKDKTQENQRPDYGESNNEK